MPRLFRIVPLLAMAVTLLLYSLACVLATRWFMTGRRATLVEMTACASWTLSVRTSRQEGTTIVKAGSANPKMTDAAAQIAA